MAALWSDRISERYRLRLPADMVDWFDSERWRLEGGAEFSRPLAPARLLEPDAETLWAGFMLPDTLPLIGNAYGDWLCLRAGADDSVAEILYWSHAGGDWIPYGRTLAESLAYDWVRCQANPAHLPQVDPSESAGPREAHTLWAREWLRRQGRTIAADWGERLRASDSAKAAATNAGEATNASDAKIEAEALRAAGVAEFAAARDAILAQLDTRLKHVADYRLAQRIGVSWEPEFVRWLFDTDFIPHDRRQQLAMAIGMDERELKQDWDAAGRLADAVAERRSDLGWAFDIAGWAAERRGDRRGAIERYCRGVTASLFADHTVPFRTHWIADGFGKFSASRLHELRAELSGAPLADPYVRLYLDGDSGDSLRRRVSRYWLERADAARAAGESSAEYDACYSAGWDLGLDELADYAGLLSRMSEAARSVGHAARGAIAAVHAARLT